MSSRRPSTPLSATPASYRWCSSQTCHGWSWRRSVEAKQLTDLGGPLGEVEIRGLTWDQVRALFGDEPAAVEATKLARGVVAGRAWQLHSPHLRSAQFSMSIDLLWFAPEELDQLQH